MKSSQFDGYRGVKLAATVGGDPSWPSVILLHGGGQTRHSWKSTAHKLVAAGFYVVSPDLRGHGESDWAEDADYSLDAFAGDVEAIAAYLDTRPVLVGASLGGIALLIAAAESSWLKPAAIILVDVVPKLEQVGVDAIRSFMASNKQGFFSVEEAADSVSKYLPHRVRPKDCSGLRKNLRQSSDGRLHWHWDPEFLKGHGVQDASARMETAAKKFRAPMLILKGEASELVANSGVEALKELVPQARFVEVRGAGHMVAGDNNNAFNEAIVMFVKGFR